MVLGDIQQCCFKMDVISLSSDDSDVEFVCGIPEVKPPLLTSDGTGVCDVSNRHPPVSAIKR